MKEFLNKYYEEGNYLEYLKLVATLVPYINRFLDEVKILK